MAKAMGIFSQFFKKTDTSTCEHYSYPWQSQICLHGLFKMLLIGETGSGKSSLVNLFCNCAKLQEIGEEGLKSGIHQFTDIELENPQSRKMESKTTGAKLYRTTLGNLEMGIIDTPGFGDTRGMDQDSENVKKIIQELQRIESINCVCLVINGRQGRLNPAIKYVFAEITAIIPREVMNNLIVVFTNTNDELELNFDIGELNHYFKDTFTPNKVFYIENPYCRLDKAKYKVQESLNVSSNATKNMAASFKTTHAVLRQMHGTIRQFKQVCTYCFIALYEKKQEIEKKVLTILVQYDELEREDVRIREEQEKIKAAIKQQQLYANYKTTQKFTRHKVVETKRHNTLCGVPNCYSNCHTPCYLSKSFDKARFKDCASMGRTDHCKKCKHHYSHHFHNEVMHVSEECEEELVDEVMKAKYVDAKNMEERAEVLIKACENRKEISKKEKGRLAKELLIAIDQFHIMGINHNYAQLLATQIDIIDLRLKDLSGDTESGNSGCTSHICHALVELQKKYKLVEETLAQEPWSYPEDSEMRKWACNYLHLNPDSKLTTGTIKSAYKAMCQLNCGIDTVKQHALQAKDILLKQLKKKK